MLPLKAVVLNVLSLTAAFGALVWVFQDGHLGALGTTPTGTLVANMPVLLFCIAFGLSMDYEVFLVARIREYWLALGDRGTGRPRADNDEAVALGLAPHRPGDHGRRAGDVDLVRGADRRAGVVHADVRRRASRWRCWWMRPLVRMVLVPAFMHVARRLELVGARTAGPAAPADRHQRVCRAADHAMARRATDDDVTVEPLEAATGPARVR